MRLKEEKILMIIGILGLAIVLSTVLIEISNYKIDAWKTELLFLQSEANDAFNNQIKFITHSHLLTFLDDIEPNFIPYGEQDHLLDKEYENEFTALWQQLKNNEISKKDYINKLWPLISRKTIQFSNLYNQKKEKISHLYKNQPKEWNLIRGIFNFIRVLTILGAAMFYILLYKSIGQRLK